MKSPIYLGLGSNMAGRWGDPDATMTRACLALAAAGIRIIAVSRRYGTAAIGPGRQPDYLNCVVAVRTALGPVALLSRLKSIERRAGRRRSAPRWTPRPLDIDIVDYAGRVAGSVGSRVAGSLVLPHPELHRRPFVVLPLAEIAPRWRHPRTGQSIQMLRWRLARQAAGRLVPQPAAGSASERPAGSARPRHDGRA